MLIKRGTRHKLYINILPGGSSVSLISERKGTDRRPHWKHLRCTHSYSADGTTICRQLHCKGPLYKWKFWSIRI